MLDKVLFLKTTPLFGAVPLEDIARFARLAESVSRSAGETIVEVGEPLRHVYVVRSGNVDLRIDGRVVETFGPHRSFGESAVFGEERSAVSFRAASTAELVRFPLSVVADLVAENPDVLASLLHDLHMRLNTLHGKLSILEGCAMQRSCGHNGSDRLARAPLLAESLFVGSSVRTEAKELT